MLAQWVACQSWIHGISLLHDESSTNESTFNHKSSLTRDRCAPIPGKQTGTAQKMSLDDIWCQLRSTQISELFPLNTATQHIFNACFVLLIFSWFQTYIYWLAKHSPLFSFPESARALADHLAGRVRQVFGEVDHVRGYRHFASHNGQMCQCFFVQMKGRNCQCYFLFWIVFLAMCVAFFFNSSAFVETNMDWKWLEHMQHNKMITCFPFMSRGNIFQKMLWIICHVNCLWLRLFFFPFFHPFGFMILSEHGWVQLSCHICCGHQLNSYIQLCNTSLSACNPRDKDPQSGRKRPGKFRKAGVESNNRITLISRLAIHSDSETPNCMWLQYLDHLRSNSSPCRSHLHLVFSCHPAKALQPCKYQCQFRHPNLVTQRRPWSYPRFWWDVAANATAKKEKKSSIIHTYIIVN